MIVSGILSLLTSAIIIIKRHGEFHGMCSEICGVLHGFMPIQGVACSIAAWVGLPK